MINYGTNYDNLINKCIKTKKPKLSALGILIKIEIIVSACILILLILMARPLNFNVDALLWFYYLYWLFMGNISLHNYITYTYITCYIIMHLRICIQLFKAFFGIIFSHCFNCSYHLHILLIKFLMLIK